MVIDIWIFLVIFLSSFLFSSDDGDPIYITRNYVYSLDLALEVV